MGNYAEWRAADVKTSGSSRCAVRDYYEHCDQSVHITVWTQDAQDGGISWRAVRIVAGWITRWTVCSTLFLEGYLALGFSGHYVVAGALIGGVVLGNLMRYAEWRFANERGKGK